MCRESKIAVAVSPSLHEDGSIGMASTSTTSSSSEGRNGGTRRKSRRTRQSSSLMDDFQVKVHARKHLEERSREMGFLCPQMYLVVKPNKRSSSSQKSIVTNGSRWKSSSS